MKGRLLLSLESTSARMSRLGKATVTGTEIVPIEETERRIAAVTAEEIAALARELYAPERLSAAGIGPSEKRFRAAVRADQSRGGRACGMRILLFGREGKVGAVLMQCARGRRSRRQRCRGRRAGRRSTASTRRSTSRAGRGARQRARGARSRRSLRDRDDRARRRRPRAARSRSRASSGSRASSRRTSRSAPC